MFAGVQGEPALCAVDGCRNPARRGRLCWAHLKRRARGRPVSGTEIRPRNWTRQDLLLEAAISLVDLPATDDEGWRRAVQRLRMAALRYARTVSTPEGHAG
jgi:hypothetical protein